MEHYAIATVAEKSADFRQVLWTGKHTQLVIMTVPVDGEIGEEVHEVDQVLSFVSGVGRAMVGGESKNVAAGDIVVVPAGTKHNFVNSGPNPLVLYTVYGPPEHADGAVQFFAFRLWQARRSGTPATTRPARPVLAFGAALAGGATVAAISLIPSSELLLLSADFVDRRGASVDKSLPFTEAVGFLMPDWWGRPTQTPFRPIMLERAVYVGALPLMLAVAAIVLRPTVTRIAVALFGGVWLAVVLGVPPLTQIVTRLPVFNSGHNTRLIVFSFLALALLAGWGLDDFSSARRRRMPGAASCSPA